MTVPIGRVAFVVFAVLLRAVIAHADGASQLQAQGENLAKQGNYAEAIDAFKAADALKPRASNACFIALAYTRRQMWPQAEIFLERCHQRATPGDPLPPWVSAADDTIAKMLASADVAAIEIVVEPEVPGTTLTVSSFAPDEAFAPRTIHLAFGHHVVFAAAPGYETAQAIVDVTTRAPQKVSIELRATGGPGSTSQPAGPIARFMSSDDERWEVLVDQRTACQTPCQLTVQPMQQVVLANANSRVELGPLPNDANVIVTAKSRSLGGIIGGYTLVGIGGTLLFTGALTLAVDCCSTGIGFGLAGGGMTVAGLLWARWSKARASIRSVPYVAGTTVGIARAF